MAKNYLPLYRPAETVTFNVSADVAAGAPVAVTGDMTVGPAAAGAAAYVGVAGHDAAQGDKLTVEVNRVIHEFIAGGAITAGAMLDIADGGKVTTAVDGGKFLALSGAQTDGRVAALQL